MSAAFTTEPVEVSGRTERGMSAAFTTEFVEVSGRTERGNLWFIDLCVLLK